MRWSGIVLGLLLSSQPIVDRDLHDSRKGVLYPLCAGVLEPMQAGVVTVTLDGVALTVVNNTGGAGTWTFTSPDYLVGNYPPAGIVGLRCRRVASGPIEIQYFDNTTAPPTSSIWMAFAGTFGSTWNGSLTWPSAGSHLNGGRTIVWPANSKTDNWNFWRAQVPPIAADYRPFMFTGLRLWSDVLIAQAWNWESILPVWYQVMEPGFGMAHRDSTNPGGNPPGALIHQWIPNDPAGAPARFPRMDTILGQTVYAGQFLVNQDDPMTPAIETNRIVAGVFLDGPWMGALYSVAGPTRVFQGAADQGNLVANGNRVLYSTAFSTYVRLDNAGNNNVTDVFGSRTTWSILVDQVVGANPAGGGAPPDTYANASGFPAITFNLGETPPASETDPYNNALTNGTCFFFGFQPHRERVAGP